MSSSDVSNCEHANSSEVRKDCSDDVRSCGHFRRRPDCEVCQDAAAVRAELIKIFSCTSAERSDAEFDRLERQYDRDMEQAKCERFKEARVTGRFPYGYEHEAEEFLACDEVMNKQVV